MNNVDYLNQISASSKKSKSASDSLLSSKPLIISLIAATVLAIFLIIFGIVRDNTTSDTKLLTQLGLRLNNFSTSVSNYNPYVKSSSLRSSGASLSSALEATTLNLKPILEEEKINLDKADKKLLDSETSHAEALNNSLEAGKLNGILDRTYASEMALQISLLISLESELYNHTKDDSLKSILSNSFENLKTLYPNFNDFSDTK